jgi:hypothetical protein
VVQKLLLFRLILPSLCGGLGTTGRQFAQLPRRFIAFWKDQGGGGIPASPPPPPSFVHDVSKGEGIFRVLLGKRMIESAPCFKPDSLEEEERRGSKPCCAGADD